MHKRFPRPPKSKDSDAGFLEGTEPSTTVGVEMAATDEPRVHSPSSSSSAVEKQAVRRRTGKERERSDTSAVRDPWKAAQRKAGASSSTFLMEASAAGVPPH